MQGGAIYMNDYTKINSGNPPTVTVTLSTLTVTDSQLIDNAALCVWGDPFNSGTDQCSEAGSGGCLYTEATSVTISTSSLQRCKVFLGSGGVLYATGNDNGPSTLTLASFADVICIPEVHCKLPWAQERLLWIGSRGTSSHWQKLSPEMVRLVVRAACGPWWVAYAAAEVRTVMVNSRGQATQ